MSRGNFIISFVEKMPLCIFFRCPPFDPKNPMEKMKVFEAAQKKKHMGETTRKNEGETWIPILAVSGCQICQLGKGIQQIHRYSLDIQTPGE